MSASKPLSIKDIAAISGVSIATVSRIVNGKSGYSAETEKRVRAVMEQYGYVSNMAAKTLREAKSHTIGLIVPNVNNEFFSSLALHIETELFEKDYSLFICNSGNSVEREKAYFRTLASRGVDGILCISDLNEIPEEITARGVPIVCIDRHPKASRPLPWVGNDDKAASREATNHLLEKGCRHILLISSYFAEYTRHEREQGYVEALEQAGIFVDQNYILHRPGKDPSTMEAEVMVYDFLKSGLPLDGIVTTSEPAALGAMYALRRAGCSVPDDVKIISFDNTLYSLLMQPTLSSIERNPRQIAQASCELLLQLIRGEDVSDTSIVVPARLVERGSTK